MKTIVLVVSIVLFSFSTTNAALICYDYTGTITNFNIIDSPQSEGLNHPDFYEGLQFEGHLYWDPYYFPSQLPEYGETLATLLTDDKLIDMTIDGTFVNTSYDFSYFSIRNDDTMDSVDIWNLGSFYFDFGANRYQCSVVDLFLYGDPNLFESSSYPEDLDLYLTQFDYGYFRTYFSHVQDLCNGGEYHLAGNFEFSINNIRQFQVPEPLIIVILAPLCFAYLFKRNRSRRTTATT